jgi:hypothetical protein
VDLLHCPASLFDCRMPQPWCRLPEGHGRQANGPNAFADRKEPETKSITSVRLNHPTNPIHDFDNSLLPYIKLQTRSPLTSH